MQKTEMVVIVALTAAVCRALGAGAENTQGVSSNAAVVAASAPKPAEPFDIPPSLIRRMEMAHYTARNRALGRINNDGEEMLALFALAASDGSGGAFPNAHIIAARPRGEMRFCNDCLNEKERERLWPFEVEKFERSLEAKMVRDTNGWFRLKGNFAQEAGPTSDDGLVASNPTFRWANHEMEQWAIKQLDGKFKRMDEAAFCKLFGEEKMPDDTFAWELDAKTGEFFVIQRCDGAWNRREYMHMVKGEEGCVVVASFSSFPNRKEAAAMRTYAYGFNAAACNNLAVLEWQHRSHGLNMIPQRIRWRLESARDQGIPRADENLRILREHIPEVFKDDDGDS